MQHWQAVCRAVCRMIEARDLSCRAADARILDSLSVRIPAARITAVLGPNGAGKSTLLHCFAGSRKPERGVVTLAGKPLGAYSLPVLARRRAMLSQSNPVNFPFTALDIVLMGRNPYAFRNNPGLDREAAEQAMASVAARHLQDRIFPSLSGGEQQRVHLARVLAQLWQQDDACLLLDEPTSALDLKHQHQLLSFVRALTRKHNWTVCVVMHDLNLAMRYSDQVVLLKDGKLFASGPRSEVLDADNIEQVFEVSAELVFHAGLTRRSTRGPAAA